MFFSQYVDGATQVTRPEIPDGRFAEQAGAVLEPGQRIVVIAPDDNT